MPYVEWNGDWCRRQPATIEEAELYLFPLRPTDPERLDGLCRLLIDGPSGGTIRATPWTPLDGTPFVLLTAARFSKIRSADPLEPHKGHISELDLGFFVPVSITVGGVPKGIFVLNPSLYVDNPAGVIMGREIFGFPKLEGGIAWSPSILEFDLHSLVFKTNTASTGATQELLVSLRRAPIPSYLAPLFGYVSSSLISGPTLPATVQAVANAVLLALGAVPNATPFTSIRLALLKQYRSAVAGVGTAYQEVVEADFEIQSISAFTVYPRFLFWLSPVKLQLFKHASVDIAQTLGLADSTWIERAFKIVCKLRLEGKPLV